MPMSDNDPVLVSIGDIAVTRTHVILPQGKFPLRGATFTVQDSTQVDSGIPAWAIVLTIIFVWFCLLGLLFLLVKEQRYNGFISVAVTGPGFYHVVQFPPGPQTGGWVSQQVNHARAIAAQA